MKPIKFFVIFLLTSCAANNYQEPSEGDMAYVSFSSLGEELPSIKMGSNCSPKHIAPDLLEKRNPKYQAKRSTKVVAEQPLTIEMDYTWLGAEQERPINRDFSYVELNSVKNVESCSHSFTFVPRTNTTYEAFVSVKGASCFIEVYESKRIVGTIRQGLVNRVNADSELCL